MQVLVRYRPRNPGRYSVRLESRRGGLLTHSATLLTCWSRARSLMITCALIHRTDASLVSASFSDHGFIGQLG